MYERLAGIKSVRIAVAAVALGALILIGLLLFDTGTRRNDEKQTAEVNEPRLPRLIRRE